jgi:hypothetical protein
MQAGHDRSVHPVFDLDAERVHRDVGHARGPAVHEQGAAEGGQVRGERGEDQRERPEREQTA